MLLTQGNLVYLAKGWGLIGTFLCYNLQSNFHVNDQKIQTLGYFHIRSAYMKNNNKIINLKKYTIVKS